MAEEKTKVVPFFALGINALPGEPLPLHIFEPKYKRMIQYCLEGRKLKEHRPFAVSLRHQKSIEPVGCLAEVRSVLKSYEDGRSLILTWGMRRYRLLEVMEEGDPAADNAGYPLAKVLLLDDQKAGVSPELQEEAIDLYGRIVAAENLDAREIPNDTELLSYSLASQIQLELAERQELLNRESERARLLTLCEIFAFRLHAIKHSSVVANQGYIQ